MPFYILAILIGLFSCSKKSDPATQNAVPANLVVNANVSTDNSGNVSFTATATNAVGYEYDFGNGIFQSVPTGIVTYQYPNGGTYTVNVTAKGAGGQTISKTLQVTVATALGLVW
jgi:PKD repeat protein